MNHPPNHPLGHVALHPQTPVVARTYGTWVLTYTVGTYGIDSGGQIKLARRLVSDWADPQFDDPQAAGYSTVETDGPAQLRVSWQGCRERGRQRRVTWDGTLWGSRLCYPSG